MINKKREGGGALALALNGRAMRDSPGGWRRPPPPRRVRALRAPLENGSRRFLSSAPRTGFVPSSAPRTGFESMQGKQKREGTMVLAFTFDGGR